MDKWYPLRQYAQQSALNISSIHGVAHFMPHDGMLPCHLTHTKLRPVPGYFESSPPFFTPGDAQASKAGDPRARVLHSKSTAPQAQ
jgi:hypothetical protein